jgi:transcriptional regulator with PAS, ATPase and Fis domain
VYINNMLKQDNFLRAIFNAIPCGVLIVDRDRRIYAVNDGLKQTFCITDEDITEKRPGDALGCVNASKSRGGCGFTEECKACVVRNAALDALSGNYISRNKTKVQCMVDGNSRELVLLISAAPFDHAGERFAVIMLEDTTELNGLRRRLKTEHSFNGIISHDPSMQGIFESIREVAEFNVPVLIQGESGTGKELVASAIHNEGSRAKKPFVPVNCAALPEGLIESELFGHVKGAFTGAVRDKKGRFELAHGGTLFLDEIGDLPKMVQVKLLRALQEGKFEPVGSEKTLSVDVRIISATNRGLIQEVEMGNFRDDLYYRLKVVPINLPPLRDRKNDIPFLVEHFLDKAAKEGQAFQGISNEALVLMMGYAWPGNVRELQSAIRYAIIKCKGGLIRPNELPVELTSRGGVSHVAKGPVRKLDQERVSAALTKAGGNKSKAARILGVGRATLYRFLADEK